MTQANVALAVAAGLGAAVAYGAAAAVQHHQAGQVAERGALNPGLLAALVRRPLWLVGVAGDSVAVALQAVALRFGPVVLVQLLIVGGLPIGAVLSTLGARQRLSRRELLGLLLCGGGLAAAVPASTLVGLGHLAGRRSITAATVVVLALTVGLLLAARARRAAPLALGLAAGVTAGTASVLLAVCAAEFGNLGHLLRTPAPYAAVVIGLVTLLLSQSAFQTGRISTPLAALSVAEPVVAVALAVAVLHQHLPSSGLALVAGGLGTAAALAGVLVLATERKD